MARWLVIVLCAWCWSCGAPPKRPATEAKHSAEPPDAKAIERLVMLAHEAAAAHRAGQNERAGALITEAQPLVNSVLAAPRPPLAAMQAASDLDDLYARMLLANGYHGWARILFQKNQARWKNWQPQTEDTARRLQQAVDGIAECDRKILAP